MSPFQLSAEAQDFQMYIKRDSKLEAVWSAHQACMLMPVRNGRWRTYPVELMAHNSAMADGF